jgi:hypothetical protein
VSDDRSGAKSEKIDQAQVGKTLLFFTRYDIPTNFYKTSYFFNSLNKGLTAVYCLWYDLFERRERSLHEESVIFSNLGIFDFLAGFFTAADLLPVPFRALSTDKLPRCSGSPDSPGVDPFVLALI